MVIYQDNYSGFQFNSLILFLINVSEKFISVFLNTYINIESKHDSSDDVTTVIDDLVIISPLKGNN